MSNRDPFDLELLRVDPNDPHWARGSTKKPAAKKKWERKFVRFPWTWVEGLYRTKSTSTYRLALLLAYEHWRNGGRPIRLSNILAAEIKINRETKRRALGDLEKLGLVKIDRRSKASPLVTPIIGLGRTD